MSSGRSYLFLAGALASVATAQTTTVFFADFEAETLGVAPGGWIENWDPQGFVTDLTPISGNSSSRVLGFGALTNGAYLSSAVIDLSGHTGAASFQLSFDYRQDASSAGESSLIIGFSSTALPLAWAVGDGVADVPTTGTVFGATWYQISLDVTSAITPFLADPAGFRLAFQNWATSPNNIGQHVYLDNITLTATAIPEPSAFAVLAGVCALGLAATRRRRRAV